MSVNRRQDSSIKILNFSKPILEKEEESSDQESRMLGLRMGMDESSYKKSGVRLDSANESYKFS